VLRHEPGVFGGYPFKWFFELAGLLPLVGHAEIDQPDSCMFGCMTTWVMARMTLKNFVRFSAVSRYAEISLKSRLLTSCCAETNVPTSAQEIAKAKYFLVSDIVFNLTPVDRYLVTYNNVDQKWQGGTRVVKLTRSTPISGGG
jgi:hypothetical protein